METTEKKVYGPIFSNAKIDVPILDPDNITMVLGC
jgi:hypothetical protein